MTTARPALPTRPFRLRPLATLVAGLGAGLAPLAGHLPVWLPAVLLLLGLWRLHLEHARRPLPGRGVLLTVTGLGSAAVLASAVGPADPDVVLGLLAFLAGAKLLETQSDRDRVSGVLVGYFLVFANLLYRDTIVAASAMGGVVLLLTASLIDVADDQETRPLAANAGLSARMLAQALPLALALFLLFPRLGGPLWGAPRDVREGTTGLSESMTPGSISRLALSDDVAFRASFPEGARGPAPLYWRGPVLEHTDGATWATRRPLSFLPLPPGPSAGLEHTVTLEPNRGHWLPALDSPAAFLARAGLTDTASLRALAPLSERVRYRAWSVVPPHPGDLTPELRSRALGLPVRVSPRVAGLAAELKRAGATDAAVVDQALRHIRLGPFSYTLEPPLLTRDPVDQFLFETRRGYCEHYAGAFTVLMRLAGIPARVVTGYLGGEWNPLGRYWIVRQADAHAWSEVWLEGRGWTRVDPTAWVAPERVQPRADFGARNAAPLLGLKGSPLARWLRHAWDSADNGWNQWVLGYGTERQFALLTRVGFPEVTWQRLTAALAAVAALLVALAAVQVARRGGPSDPARALYRRYCRKLARRGLPRLPHEGPRTYGDRVCAMRPALSSQVGRVTEAYEALCYGPPPTGRREAKAALARLRQAVAEFRP